MTTTQLLLSVSKERKAKVGGRREEKEQKERGNTEKEGERQGRSTPKAKLFFFFFDNCIVPFGVSPVGNVSTTARNCVFLISGMLVHSDSFFSSYLPTYHFNFCRPVLLFFSVLFQRAILYSAVLAHSVSFSPVLFQRAILFMLSRFILLHFPYSLPT